MLWIRYFVINICEHFANSWKRLDSVSTRNLNLHCEPSDFCMSCSWVIRSCWWRLMPRPRPSSMSGRPRRGVLMGYAEKDIIIIFSDLIISAVWSLFPPFFCLEHKGSQWWVKERGGRRGGGSWWRNPAAGPGCEGGDRRPHPRVCKRTQRSLAGSWQSTSQQEAEREERGGSVCTMSM